ncbi:MAG: hypothetical protein ABIH92_00045 [Nanoarchaeota archaeon]
MRSKVFFADEKLEELFQKLNDSKTEDKNLYRQLLRTFEELEKDMFSGIQIPKRLIPKEYERRYGKIHNLWKYNLPNAWRLIYTIKKQDVVVLSLILEWLPHKEYEKRFKY